MFLKNNYITYDDEYNHLKNIEVTLIISFYELSDLLDTQITVSRALLLIKQDTLSIYKLII